MILLNFTMEKIHCFLIDWVLVKQPKRIRFC